MTIKKTTQCRWVNLLIPTKLGLFEHFRTILGRQVHRNVIFVVFTLFIGV